MLLWRVARPDSERTEGRDSTEWKVVATTLVDVRSINVADPSHATIVSLTVRTGDFDMTITDPMGWIWRDRVPMFAPDSPVAITVTTNHPDDVVVLMHHDRRFRLHPNGDNTYSGEWMAPRYDGIRHVGINALTHDTLFDDIAPYSSEAWLWHYGVRHAGLP